MNQNDNENLQQLLQFPVQTTLINDDMSDDEVVFQTRLVLVQNLTKYNQQGIPLPEDFKKNVRTHNQLCSEYGYYKYMIDGNFD
jgi:hypothetical protein